MKTVLVKAKQIAYQMGVMFANTLTSVSVSGKDNKWHTQ